MASDSLPHPQRLVPAGGEDEASIRRVCTSCHPFGVAFQDMKWLTACNLPHPQPLVLTGGNDEAPIRRERTRVHTVSVAFQSADQRCGLLEGGIEPNPWLGIRCIALGQFLRKRLFYCFSLPL